MKYTKKALEKIMNKVITEIIIFLFSIKIPNPSFPDLLQNNLGENKKSIL